MHFWRIEELKSTLRQRPLSSRETLSYVVAIVVAYAASSECMGYFPRSSSSALDYGISLAWIVIAATGTVYVYHANGGASGHDFVERYLAVSWVMGWRYAAAFIILFTGAFLVLDRFSYSWPDEDSWKLSVTFMLGECLLFWRIATHVRGIAAANVA